MYMSWSTKYKKSIDCDNPKGFSQKAHCDGRDARKRGEKTKSKSPFKENGVIKLTRICEASEIDVKELNPTKQKQVLAFAKIVDGKLITIFDGIHGNIVDIEVSGNFNTGYRWGADELKKLLALKIRWVEADGDLISIGF